MAARSGDASAREELLSRYAEELQAFLGNSARGPAIRRRVEPDDLFQETVKTFLERLSGFPEDLDEPALRAYLFQIAKWKIGDVTKRKERVLREASVELGEPQQSEPSRGPVTRADDSRHLRDLIGRMREPHAEILRLCVLEGRDLDGAAAELGLSRESVRKRLERARAALDDQVASWREQEA